MCGYSETWSSYFFQKQMLGPYLGNGNRNKKQYSKDGKYYLLWRRRDVKVGKTFTFQHNKKLVTKITTLERL